MDYVSYYLNATLTGHNPVRDSLVNNGSLRVDGAVQAGSDLGGYFIRTQAVQGDATFHLQGYKS